MKRVFAVFLVVAGVALATGLDFGFSVRGDGPRFMGSLGLSVDAPPLSVRGSLVVGAPADALLLEGDVRYLFGGFGFTPYVGAGVGLGVAAWGTGDALVLRVGERAYAALLLGLAFPERGYRPYLEVARYFGTPGFTRFTVGFVAEAF